MGTCIIFADINTKDLFDLDFVIIRKVISLPKSKVINIAKKVKGFFL